MKAPQAPQVLLGAIVAAVALSACSVATPESDQIGLHYSGGPLSAKKFQNCVDPSTRETHGVGESYYYYPTRQVSLDASRDSGAEMKPIQVVSKDNVVMDYPVTVVLQLNTSCKVLQAFHQAWGLKYAAYWTNGESSSDNPPGWKKLLVFLVGKPLSAALTRIALQYNWQSMRDDPKVKAAIDTEINSSISSLVKRQAQGDYFIGFEALTQAPVPDNPKLLNAVADQQAGIAEAKAAQAKAQAGIAAARAQAAQAKAAAKAQEFTIKGYGGIDGYLKYQLILKGGNPYQPTYIYGGQVQSGQ